MGERALTGTKKLALEGSQPHRSFDSPSTTGDHVVDVGVVLELSAPGMQDTEKARAVGANETLVFGEPFEGLRRSLEHGLVGHALM